jgi:hypothetical protein
VTRGRTTIGSSVGRPRLSVAGCQIAPLWFAVRATAFFESGEGGQVPVGHGVEYFEASSDRPANQNIPGVGRGHGRGTLIRHLSRTCAEGRLTMLKTAPPPPTGACTGDSGTTRQAGLFAESHQPAADSSDRGYSSESAPAVPDAPPRDFKPNTCGPTKYFRNVQYSLKAQH